MVLTVGGKVSFSPLRILDFYDVDTCSFYFYLLKVFFLLLLFFVNKGCCILSDAFPAPI